MREKRCGGIEERNKSIKKISLTWTSLINMNHGSMYSSSTDNPKILLTGVSNYDDSQVQKKNTLSILQIKQTIYTHSLTIIG